MSHAARAERWAFIVSLIGMAAFLVADDQPILAAIALALAATARSLAREGKPSGEGEAAARRAGIPRWTLNTLIVGAVAFAAFSTIRKPEDFVSSIGTLLCSLQVIRFFDRLATRDLRQVLTMSVFTVVAAVLTSNSLIVGTLLLIYTPSVAWAIMLCQIAGAHDRLARRLPDTPAPPGAPPRFGRDARRLLTGMTVSGAAFAAIVFVALPRSLGADMFVDWSSPTAGGGASAGFTDKVQLGRSGELGESQETILDLQVSDETGRNVGAADRPALLRGLVFDEYNARTHAWVRSEAAANMRTQYTAPAVADRPISLTKQRGLEILSQRITIRNKQSDYLFVAGRPLRIAFDRETNLLMGRTDNVLVASGRSGRVTYTVDSQTDYSPAPDQAGLQPLPALFRAGPIRELTERVLRENGFTRDPASHFTESDLSMARFVERYLRSEYRYSREMTPPRDGEDPIEMFLFRTRQGHCEYFASAMAAMLRSVGVDARVVGGYRASEFNEIAGQYTVRQSDAHSWVEAQVALGLWTTFDPSPPDSVAAMTKRPGGALGAVRHLYDAAEQAWVAWVVGFDHQARTAIFGAPKGNVRVLTGRLEALTRMPIYGVAGRALRAGLVGAIAFSVVSTLYLCFTALRRRLRDRAAIRGGGRPLDPAAIAFERAREAQAKFYERLLERLERLGAGKPRWRAPMDHLASLEPRLAPLAGHARALTRLYYELRFSPRLLTEAELAQAGERLDALDAAARGLVAPAGPRTRGRGRG